MTRFIIALLVIAATVPSVRAEEFVFTWDDETDGLAAETATDQDQAATTEGDGFKFDWENEQAPGDIPDQIPAEPAKPAEEPEIIEIPPEVAPVPKISPTGKSGINAAAYNKLLQENLALQARIKQTTEEEAAVRRDNARLGAEVKDLERRIQLSLQLIQKLETARGTSGGNQEETNALELQLAEAEQEKARLSSELVALRGELQKAMSVADERTAPEAARPEDTVKTDSALFRRLEEENTLLRKNLLEVEKERQKALKDRVDVAEKADEAKGRIERADRERDKLKKQLAAARETEEEHRKLVTELMTRIPDMQERLLGLGLELTAKDVVLEQRDKALETLKIELERRENRLAKAEKMAVLLEKAREEVRRVSDVEKRDMHYNMAAIYAKEGRPRDAEKEYLKALRVDPTDADVHYNLGILYDEELDDDRRAAMHYRKYLKLSPHGEDVDVVREWLRQIEMAR